MTKKPAPAPLPTITLDSRPIYLVEGYTYDTYDDAMKHVLRGRIEELYGRTGVRP